MNPKDIAKLITEHPDIMNEAVIIPEMPDIDDIIAPYIGRRLDEIKDELNAALEPHRIKFLPTNEFIEKTKEEGLAPPPGEGHGIYTAATSPITGNIYFIYNPRSRYAYIPAIEMIHDILKHELVHRVQVERGARDTVDPGEKESYLSNKQEIMAFARVVADGLKDYPQEYVKDILRGEEVDREGQFIMPWQRIMNLYRDIGGDVYKRFSAYLYDYLKLQETIT
jgi:hypothetical protein